MRYLATLLVVAALTGCASVKPFLTCRTADARAVVNQGYMGLGIGQEIPDADALCAGLKTPAKAAP